MKEYYIYQKKVTLITKCVNYIDNYTKWQRSRPTMLREVDEATYEAMWA